MTRFLAGVVFIFVLPYLFFKLAMWYAVPFFGITNHQWLAAVGMAVLPSIPSLLIGWFCASGARLPDN
jgi:hypothetical protein